MARDLLQERQQTHALIDLLPPAKLGAVRSLLEVMLEDEDGETLTEADRSAIQTGLDSLEKNGAVSMETVMSDFGLSLADLTTEPTAPDSRRDA